MTVVFDLSVVACMTWALWRIYCVFMDEWIVSRPIYSTFNVGEDVLNNGEWSAAHVWDNCICGCDPDWHYLNSRALLCCSNCKDDGLPVYGCECCGSGMHDVSRCPHKRVTG